MPAEDRDRLFEKALARQLRAESGAGDSACPDAEVLSAYHERLLAADEMMSAKSHIVSCARCQEILAQLEMTQEVQEPLEREGNVIPAGTVPALVREAQPNSRKVAAFPGRKTNLLRWAAPAGAVAAGILIWAGLRDFRAAHTVTFSGAQIAENRNESPPTPGPPAAGPDTRAKAKGGAAPGEERQQEQEMRRSDVLRDETPALRSANRPKEQANAANVSSAPVVHPSRTREAAPKAGSAAASSATGFASGVGAGAGGAALAKKEDLDAVAADKSASYDAQSIGGLQKNEDKAPAAAGGVPAAPMAPPPSRAAPVLPAAKAVSPSRSADSGQLHGMVTDPSGAAVAGAFVALKSEKGSTVASTSTDRTGSYSFNGVAVGSYQLELQRAGFKTESFARLDVAPGDNEMNAKLQVGALAETVEVTAQTAFVNSDVNGTAARGKDEKQLEVTAGNVLALKTLQSLAASSPDGKNVWRFGGHGEITHSSDGGNTWEPQTAPVTVMLTSGSAPSKRVCWIAGASGTLLRTTDRGKHWRLVATPITLDLGGVQARDERHATIWDLKMQMRYETSDGGVTWKNANRSTY